MNLSDYIFLDLLRCAGMTQTEYNMLELDERSMMPINLDSLTSLLNLSLPIIKI